MTRTQLLSRHKKIDFFAISALPNPDDAIKFVSNTSSISIEPKFEKEKHKVDDVVTIDKNRTNLLTVKCYD
jgi:hypothetical protein